MAIGNHSLTTNSVRELAEATKRVRAANGAGRNATGPEQEARRIAREVHCLGVDEVGVLG